MTPAPAPAPAPSNPRNRQRTGMPERPKQPSGMPAGKSGVSRALGYVVPPCLITCLLWVSSNNPIRVSQALLALVLLFVPWISFQRWEAAAENAAAVFCFDLGNVLAVLRASAVLGRYEFVIFGSRGPHISEAAITAVILMAVIGALAMLAGTFVGPMVVAMPKFSTDSPLTTKKWLYIDCILIARILGTSYLSRGGDARQVVYLLLEFIPLIAFALLFQKLLVRRATLYEKILLGVFLLVKTATGLASGWMGSVVGGC